MPRVNRTQHAILGLLSLRPMSGYDIRQFVRGSIAHFWSESYGQIYTTLERLERAKLVAGRTRAAGGGRERREYRLTPAGRRILREWLSLPAQAEAPRIELLLKLFFGANVPPEINRAHLRRYRDQHLSLRTIYAEHERTMLSRTDRPAHWIYQYAVLRAGVLMADAVLAWCDESEQLLSGGPAAPWARRRSATGTKRSKLRSPLRRPPGAP